ncbi:unnamed protein product [Peniophora sp. CBMAI 1063]|nr:unnamed protein product [Peniophora sp. CBMAI 1063]
MSATNPSTKSPFTMNEKTPTPLPLPVQQAPEPEDPSPRRKSVSYVLWRVLVATVLLWVGWDALSGLGYGMFRAFRYFHPARTQGHSPDMKILSHGDMSCLEWTTSTDGPHIAHATYAMPLDAGAYLFDAHQYSCASGEIRFVSKAEPREDMLVDVTAQYTEESAKWLSITNVCHVSHELGQGMVLMPKTKFQHSCACSSNPIQYNITVHVPAGANIPLLKTNMASFAHNLEGLSSDVTLGAVRLVGSSAVIKEIKADSVSFNVDNTAITGFYNVTSSLELKTTNAPIDVEVDAYGHHPVWIRLITTNNKIDADVSLYEVSRHGRFDVFAKTTNGEVNVDILESPVGGIVKADAITTNAPARLALGPAFEGEIAAHTSNAQALVDRTPSEDPTGEGRERTIELGHVWETGFRGWTSWSAGRKSLRSRARVSSTNKPVVLAF